MDNTLLNVNSPIEQEHISSTLQPDTLFHFMERVEWLIEIINKKIYASQVLPRRY